MVPLYSPSGEEQAVAAKQFNPPWWNYTFRYRRQVNFTDTSGVNHVEQPVDIYLTFTNGECYNNSIRVRYWTGAEWLTIPCQVWNETYYSGTSYYQSLTLTFYVNVSASTTETGYYIYYNDTDSGVESYQNEVWYTFNGTHYIFESNIYRANTSTIARGGKIEDCYNKISGTDWTHTTITNQVSNVYGFHWNPDYGYSTGTTSKYSPAEPPQILESGPLFITYTTLAKLGDYNAYCRINYRFFRWGWIGETNSTFNDAASGQVYRNNEWVFNPGIMKNFTYKEQYGSPTTITFSGTSNDINLENPDWFCLWDQSDGEAAGTFDLVTPQTSGVVVASGDWDYRVFWRSTNYYEFWDRYWGTVDFNAGGWIYEKFAIYIWNGAQGYAPFQSFAEAMRAGLTVSVSDTPEDVFYKLEVQVVDPTNHPIPGVNVSIYNDAAYSSLNVSKLTDDNGRCTFYLYYRSGGYYVQANLSLNYLPSGDQYINQTGKWMPGTDPSSLTIKLNATKLYLEVYDALGTLVQNANITINYTSGPQNIVNQPVNLYYANVCLYVKAGAAFYINVSTPGNPNENITLYNMSDSNAINQPLTISEPTSIRVELNRTINIRRTMLECEGGNYFTVNWSGMASFSVWIKWDGPNVGINASWVNYTISYLNGTVVVSQTKMTENTSVIGQWYVTLNTSEAGLLGGYTYLVTFYGEPQNTTLYAYPEPLSVFLVVEELPVTVEYQSFINVTWSSPPSFNVTVYLNDTTRNLPVTSAIVHYSILDTPYSGTMNNHGNGNYSIPTDVLGNLTTGTYTIEVTPSAQNYSIPSAKITLAINPVSTDVNVLSSSLQGTLLTVVYNRTITISVEFRDAGGNPVLGALVIWSIDGTEYSGLMQDEDGDGVYTASLNLSETTLEPGTYLITFYVVKQNYQHQNVKMALSVSSIPTTITTVILPLSNKFIVGPYTMVENNVPFVPLLFTIKDDYGRPVTGANLTMLGLPVWELGSGLYFTIIPVSGLPDSALPLTVQAQKTYYQTASTVVLLKVNEWTIPLVNVPYRVFAAILVSVLVPASAFASYVYVQRARIPPIIRRIDYLIERIGKGLPVEVGKPLTRDSVIEQLLREELALVGVEPRAVRYVPPEVADRLVPLLVEIGKSESAAHAILAELRASTPAEREKLLETVGVPPDISATILQELEKEEEERLLKEKVEEKEEEKEEGSEAGREAEEKPEGGSEGGAGPGSR